MIKAVVFDMDGVVVNSERLYQKAEKRLFKEYGVTIPDEDWKLFRGCGEAEFFQLVRERYGINQSPDTLRQRGQRYILTEFDANLNFNDGFLELHHRLDGRFLLGLVTSTPGELFQWLDQRLELRRYFHEVIHGGMTANSKPHPEPYLEMMRRLNVKPEETVVIEDSIHGLSSALAAGAWTIALTGTIPREDLPPANAMVDSLVEITPARLDELSEIKHH